MVVERLPRRGPVDVSPYAAPARADELGGLPPAYVMTAELDPLRDEGIEYAMRLLHAGVSVELHQFAGAFHGFDLLPTAISRRARTNRSPGRACRDQHHVVKHTVRGGTMNRLRTLLVVSGLVILFARGHVRGSLHTPSRAAEKPKATEIGVTATQIKIAVEADVDNPFVPGLFQGVVDGVQRPPST